MKWEIEIPKSQYLRRNICWIFFLNWLVDIRMLFRSLIQGLFSGWLHEEPNLLIILNYLYLQILTSLLSKLLPHSNPPCRVFPCGRKPNNTEKTHDFRQSVYELFPRVISCLIQGRRSLRRLSYRSPYQFKLLYFYLSQKLSECESSNTDWDRSMSKRM